MSTPILNMLRALIANDNQKAADIASTVIASKLAKQMATPPAPASAPTQK